MIELKNASQNFHKLIQTEERYCKLKNGSLEIIHLKVNKE